MPSARLVRVSRPYLSRVIAMKNHPPYASTAGGERLDAGARAACRSREHPDCKEMCVQGCAASDDDLWDNGSFQTACAVIEAMDRFDDKTTQ